MWWGTPSLSAALGWTIEARCKRHEGMKPHLGKHPPTSDIAGRLAKLEIVAFRVSQVGKHLKRETH